MRTRYGAGPVHLLVMVGCFALASYAGVRLLDTRPLAVAIWFTAAVVAHDLMLFPLYTPADRSAQAVLRRRAPLRVCGSTTCGCRCCSRACSCSYGSR